MRVSNNIHLQLLTSDTGCFDNISKIAISRFINSVHKCIPYFLYILN